MRIVVDFLPLLARGGGLQNARNLWRTVLAEGRAHRWLAFGRPDLGLSELGAAEHAELREVDPGSASGDRGRSRVASLAAGATVSRFRFQNVELVRAARRFEADVLFTPMGVGAFRGAFPRVIGWHDSTIAYFDDFAALEGWTAAEAVTERLRRRLARASGRRADRICVQTEAMADRLAAEWDVPRGRFHIVPNGPSTFLRDAGRAPEHAPDPATVLVVAEPKPAKNLEVVPQVARLLADRGRDLRWRVTCDAPAPGTALARALGTAGDPDLDFTGRVPHERLSELYQEAAVVLLPSWVESFSATYVEAMHFGVPLVTSDRDFARAICGDAALYADPADPAALADAVETVLDDPAVRPRQRAAGFARLPRFPDWSGRLALYLEALEAATGSRAPIPVAR